MVSNNSSVQIEPPRPRGSMVEEVTRKATGVLAKLERKGAATGALPLEEIGYGMMSSVTSVGRHATYNNRLVRCADWSPAGCLVSRSRQVRGCGVGYLRVGLMDGRVYEAFADEESLGMTTLLRDGRVLGWWRAIDFSYEGRFATPLRRELWMPGRRLAMLETANLKGGCAVLELEPDRQLLVPLRVTSPGVIEGDPWKEVWKMTPFGRGLGERAPNLDTVLTRQALEMLEEEELDLVFAASLSLRGMELVKVSSD